MSQSVIVMGMVLTAMPVNDYDKRITILTKERGKITAFARGARRPSSQLLAATNPFAFGEFEVFEGRNSYNVTKANIQNYFRELVLDLDAASLGFYLMSGKCLSFCTSRFVHWKTAGIPKNLCVQCLN